MMTVCCLSKNFDAHSPYPPPPQNREAHSGKAPNPILYANQIWGKIVWITSIHVAAGKRKRAFTSSFGVAEHSLPHCLKETCLSPHSLRTKSGEQSFNFDRDYWRSAIVPLLKVHSDDNTLQCLMLYEKKDINNQEIGCRMHTITSSMLFLLALFRGLQNLELVVQKLPVPIVYLSSQVSFQETRVLGVETRRKPSLAMYWYNRKFGPASPRSPRDVSFPFLTLAVSMLPVK